MFLIRRLFLPVFLCLALFLSVPLHAADINAEEAKRLQSLFEETITEYKEEKDSEHITIVFDGDVEAEATDTHYAITLPHASIEYADKSKINIGFISINAKPAKIEGGWNMAIAIPSPVKLIDPKGKTVGEIEIAEQKTIGIWIEEERQFLKLDATYKNITLTDSDDLTAFIIPELTTKIDFEIDEQNLWSGPVQFKIKDLNSKSAAAGIEFSAKEIAMHSMLEQYNPRSLKNNNETLKILAAMHKEQGNKVQSPNQVLGFWNLLFDIIKTSFNSFKIGLKVEEIKVIPYLTPLHQRPPQDLSIKDAQVSLELNNIMEPKAGLRIRTGFTGFENKNDNDDLTDIYPSDSLIDISLDNIPVEELITLAQSTLQSATQHPSIAGLSKINLLIKLPMVLSEAGTKLQVKQNYITGKEYNIDLNGVMEADSKAMNSATANAKAIITGLDKLITKVENKIDTVKNPAQKDQLHALHKQLLQLRSFSKEVTDEQGNVTREAELIMTPEGKIMLNGQDISLLGAVMGQGDLIKNMMP